MRRPIIAGNWKMNKTVSETEDFIKEFLPMVEGINDRDIVIAPPYTSLADAAKLIKGSNVKLAAQNIFWEEKGAFTGEISPLMLIEIGCSYIIIGHSERRKYFYEDNSMVNRKIKAALIANLTSIMCLGETLEERKKGKTLTIVERQLHEGLEGLEPWQAERIIIAYEPIWAIGTGVNATPQQAQEVHSHIRQQLSSLFGEIGLQIRIQYGGSVKPDNINDLMAEADIDGALVGGASLKPSSFAALVKFKLSS
jgi:triosephosphate isomerase